jgi:hypothetical protein
MATERMGLRVVKNTLSTDWLNADGAFGPKEFRGVRGVVELEITEKCILQPNVILEIAELIAKELADECLERTVSVTYWNIIKDGSAITLSPADADHLDPDTGMSWRGLPSWVGLVVLIVPSCLLWA